MTERKGRIHWLHHQTLCIKQLVGANRPSKPGSNSLKCKMSVLLLTLQLSVTLILFLKAIRLGSCQDQGEDQLAIGKQE